MADSSDIRTMTAAEFLALPETLTPTQLLNGEIMMAPAPTVEHQRILKRLLLLLEAVVTDGEVFMSPIDVHFDEANVVQPDLFWTAPDSTCHLVDDNKHMRGAPELVVEVFSPGSVRLDRGAKYDLYEKHGVGEYWMVDPTGQYVEVMRHDEERFVRQGVLWAGGDLQLRCVGRPGYRSRPHPGPGTRYQRVRLLSIYVQARGK